MPTVQGDKNLFFSTGLNLNGLKSGVAGATGILKGFASNVTKVDILGGVALGAGVAFGKLSKMAYGFSKDYQTSMKEVMTISNAVKADFKGISDELLDMSTRIKGVDISEMPKAFYQVVSAGYDGAKGLKVLEEASKGAVAGLASVEITVDGLTTVLNAFGKDASESSDIMDQFFLSVERGKQTLPELAQGLNIVAPIASSTGVAFEQVMAAMDTLTKQGTPAAQAFTQIRAAIVGLNNALDDGWTQTMTFQEAMEQVAKSANYSANAIRETLGGRIEAVMGVLAMTGKNAKMATDDLKAHQNAVGKAAEAYAVMGDTADNELKKLTNNIMKRMKPTGDFLMEMVSDVSRSINESFDMMGDANKAVALELDKVSEAYQRKINIARSLISTLEELAGKEELTAQQASEMESIERQLAALIPEVSQALMDNASALDLVAIGKRAVIDLTQEQIDKDIKSLELKKKIAELELKSIELTDENTDKTKKQIKEQVEWIRSLVNEYMKAPGDVLMQDLAFTSIPGFAAEFDNYQSRIEAIKKIQDATKREMETEKLRNDIIENAIENDRKKLGLEINLSKAEAARYEKAEKLKKVIEETDKLLIQYSNIVKELTQEEKDKYLQSIKTLEASFKSKSMSSEEYIKSLKDMKSELRLFPDLVSEIDKRLAKTSTKPIAEKTGFDKKMLEKRQQEYEDYLDFLTTRTKEEISVVAPELVKRAEAYPEWLQEQLGKFAASDEQATREILLAITSLEKQKAKKEDKSFQKQLESLETYEKKKTEISERYEKLRQDIKQKYAEEEQAEMLERLENQRILEEEDLRQKVESENEKIKLLEYRKKYHKDIMEDISKDTSRMTRKELEAHKQLLKKLAELYKDNESVYKLILQAIIKTNEEATKRAVEQIEELGNAIKGLSRLVSNLDNNLSESLNTMGDLIKESSRLFQNIEKGNIFGVIESGANLLSDIFSPIFGSGETQTNTIVKSIDKLTKTIKEQDMALNDLYGSDRIKKIAEFYAFWEKEVNRLEKLQQNILSGPIVAEEYEMALDRMNEFKTELEEALTGTSKNEIADAIIKGFEEGKRGAKDFADTFEDFMADAMKESFKRDIISKEVAKFYNAFVASQEGEGIWANFAPQEAMARLKLIWKKTIISIDEKWQDLIDLSEGTGINLFDDISKEAGGLQGAIKGMSEETATILAGQFNAMRINMTHIDGYARSIDLNVQDGLAVAERSLKYLSEIADNTKYNKHLESIDMKLSGETSMLRAVGG